MKSSIKKTIAAFVLVFALVLAWMYWGSQAVYHRDLAHCEQTKPEAQCVKELK